MFKIGQDAYNVRGEKIYVVKIRAIIKRFDKNGETIKYEVEDYNGRTREVTPAYLVADWETAKQASMNNWTEIVQRVTGELQTQKKVSFKEAQKLYKKAVDKQKKEKK